MFPIDLFSEDRGDVLGVLCSFDKWELYEWIYRATSPLHCNALVSADICSYLLLNDKTFFPPAISIGLCVSHSDSAPVLGLQRFDVSALCRGGAARRGAARRGLGVIENRDNPLFDTISHIRRCLTPSRYGV